MIEVISIYQDFLDDISKDSYVTKEMFNRYSRRAELKLQSFLSGGDTGVEVPAMYNSQKTKDLLNVFITKLPQTILDGHLVRPEDYFRYENMYVIGNASNICEDDEDSSEICNNVITLISASQYNFRCTTDIEELKPTFDKAVSKEIGNAFEFTPKDLGNVVLEYVRYPKFAKLEMKLDPIYNEEIPDVVRSNNYEWGEEARDLLLFFMADMFANHTREQALKQFNQASKK